MLTMTTYGMWGGCHAQANGSIIRSVLRNLEKMGLVEKCEDGWV